MGKKQKPEKAALTDDEETKKPVENEDAKKKDKSGRTGACWNGRCHTCKGGGITRDGGTLKTYRCTHECHIGQPEQPLPDLTKAVR